MKTSDRGWIQAMQMDQDRQNPLHEIVVRYLLQKEKMEKLVMTFAPPNPCRDYEQFGVKDSFKINELKCHGSTEKIHSSDNGFVQARFDLVIKYNFSTEWIEEREVELDFSGEPRKVYGHYVYKDASRSTTWTSTPFKKMLVASTGDNRGRLVVEVKTDKNEKLSNIIAQLNYYRELNFEMTGAIVLLATSFQMNQNDVNLLKNEGFNRIWLNPKDLEEFDFKWKQSTAADNSGF